MEGMFDIASRMKAGQPTQVAQLSAGVRGAQRATPEQIKAAAASLMARGITPTAVNVAEEIAAMTAAPAPPAAAPMVPGAGRVGPQGSEEMLARIKAEQAAKNQEMLRRAMEERRRMSGAR